MSKIVVHNSVTLDGVMQSPGGREEDTRGGFTRGGWAVPYGDEVMMSAIGEGMATAGSLLFGRRTYEQFHGYWPHQTDNPFTDVLNDTQKYVASTTLAEPLPWQNSTLLAGDAMEGVAQLRAQPGKDVVVLGSGELIQELRRRDLIDRYVLLIHPLVLGEGRRMFRDGAPTDLRLVKSVTTTTGVIIGTYEPVRAA